MMTQDDIVLSIPDLILWCPWTPLTNPHYERARPESSDWIDSFKFFQGKKREHFMQSSTELFASYTYPYATFEDFRALCDCMNILWTIDEMLDDQRLPEVRETADVFIKAMKDDFKNDKPIVRMISEWKSQVRHKFGVNSWRRFIEIYSDFLLSIVHEKELEDQNVLDSLKEYESHRRNNVFMSGCFCLAEYALGFDLPDVVFEDKAISAIHWAAVDMIGYSNDIYSYGREREIGLDRTNILTIVMHEKQLTLQQAVDYVGELFRSLVRKFEENKKEVPSFNAMTGDTELDGHVQRYITALELAVAGNLSWSFETKRYFGEDRENVKNTLTVRLKSPLLG